MCDSCDKVLNLEAHEIFWQLLMEKEFIGQVLKALPTSTESMSTASCSRVLTYIEENAIRYTAGYVIRKLENMYARRKEEHDSQCTAALREMAGKLNIIAIYIVNFILHIFIHAYQSL